MTSNGLTIQDDRLFLLNADVEKYLIQEGYQHELRASCIEFSNHFFSSEKTKQDFIRKFSQSEVGLLEFLKSYKAKVSPIWAEKISEIGNKNRRFPPKIKSLFEAIAQKLNIKPA